MQFLTSLFGGSENALLNAALALGIVLVLIVLALWVLKVFFRASSTLAGRSKRLSVVDTIMVDSKRRLIIVRRDNVDHLILTGGPQDVVVETGIPVERLPAGLRRGLPEPAGGTTERPSPSYPVSDALQAAQAISGTADAPALGAMDRLREMGRSGDQRKWNSLRHTGLLRPVSRMVPAAIIPINTDNSDNRRVDSAKTGPGTGQGGQGTLGGGKHPGGGSKAGKI